MDPVSKVAPEPPHNPRLRPGLRLGLQQRPGDRCAKVIVGNATDGAWRHCRPIVYDGPGSRDANVAVWSIEVQALARELELARRRALHFESGVVCM
jgi:hypothetical protein